MIQMAKMSTLPKWIGRLKKIPIEVSIRLFADRDKII